MSEAQPVGPSGPLNLWLISPYHSGSHRAWAEGYRRHSRHQVQLFAMAGRFWKWRMQGGAIDLAHQARSHAATAGPPAAVLATDMLNLPAWWALLRDVLPPHTPLFLYMHENQLTYPLRPGESPDLTYGMINWLSQMAADGVLFNSRFHLESWFDALPRLLKHFPDYTHLERVDAVRARCTVLPVGVELPPPPDRAVGDDPPLILWNQRWEYDKRPDRFFGLLRRLARAEIDFRLAVVGENFRNSPEEFERARGHLAPRIVQWGYLPSAVAYRRLLEQADLVISTADHEFFGISMVEAIGAGAFPLLPRRLSYPELIPPHLHPACLYGDEDELFAMARNRLQRPRPAPPSLQEYVRRNFAWPVVARRYDGWIARAVQGGGG